MLLLPPPILLLPPPILLFPPTEELLLVSPSSLQSSPSSSSFPLPKRPETTRTPSLSSSNMTHSRVGLGRIVERHARVRALARAHLSSASPWGKVPRAMVLPAHFVSKVSGWNEIRDGWGDGWWFWRRLMARRRCYRRHVGGAIIMPLLLCGKRMGRARRGAE